MRRNSILNTLKIKGVFLLFFLLLLGSCRIAKPETDWLKDDLSDRVKKVTQVAYKYSKKQDVEWEKQYTNIKEYNKKGYKVEELEYDKNLKLIEKNTFQYKGGRLRESSTNYYSNRGDWDISYKYKKGNLSEKVFARKNGKSFVKDIYTYDKDNRPKTYCRYDNFNELQRKRTFEYDEQGRRIKDTYFNHFNDFYKKSTYEYDDKGNKIEYRYRCKGDNCDLKAKFLHLFDEEGNEIGAKVFDKKGKLLSRVSSKYDERGNCISEEIYNPDGTYKKGEKYEFVYDSKGNWIRCTLYVNGTLDYKAERTLEYFKE